MKNKKRLAVIGFSGILMMAGCSSSPEKKVNLDPVAVSQPGDSRLSCDQLKPKLLIIEKDVQELFEIKEERQKRIFGIQAIVDMVLAFLSGSASANNHIDGSTLDGFTQPELKRIQSLADRHHFLLDNAKNKNCTFAPQMEKNMAKYKKMNSMPMPEEGQSYRQRMTP
ncbi:hypothetical protein CYQ88_07745 [Hydrogenovibrio sp. SC-1]|uniref:hypothetical protein n=1 Tax=Hydrogenovibrio sp. SC-1 TaxID=2065820 RepID=UPI000C7CEAE7|nr:hypothetical protein [Hydrogenovibrio sp. SC-1]PLA74125.1 hypothetical protein CYQ88_07745 [Hydrogenovibrio sp. SC-1]